MENRKDNLYPSLSAVPVAKVAPAQVNNPNLVVATPVYQPLPEVTRQELEGLLDRLQAKRKKLYEDSLAANPHLHNHEYKKLHKKLYSDLNGLEKEVRHLMHKQHNNNPEKYRFYKKLINVVLDNVSDQPTDANVASINNIAKEMPSHVPPEPHHLMKGFLYGIAAAMLGLFTIGYLAASIFVSSFPRFPNTLFENVFLIATNLALGVGTLSLTGKSVGFFAHKHQSPVEKLERVAEDLNQIKMHR